MPRARFNHLELTYAPGTLDQALRADIDAFYGDIFGWKGSDYDLLGQQCHYLEIDGGEQFVLLAESKKVISSPGYDHIGMLMDTRAEVDETLEMVQRYKEKDDRVEIKLYDDLPAPIGVVHSFYVRYLLPIYLDVQVIEYTPGMEPEHRWRWV